MAQDAINKNDSILKDYSLKLHAYDGQCRTDKVMKSFIDYIRLYTFPHMAGILGKLSNLLHKYICYNALPRGKLLFESMIHFIF